MIKFKKNRITVLPDYGDVTLKCGNCGNKSFKLYATPLVGASYIKEAVCTRCSRVARLNPENNMIEAYIKKEM